MTTSSVPLTPDLKSRMIPRTPVTADDGSYIVYDRKMINYYDLRLPDEVAVLLLEMLDYYGKEMYGTLEYAMEVDSAYKSIMTVLHGLPYPQSGVNALYARELRQKAVDTKAPVILCATCESAVKPVKPYRLGRWLAKKVLPETTKMMSRYKYTCSTCKRDLTSNDVLFITSAMYTDDIIALLDNAEGRAIR